MCLQIILIVFVVLVALIYLISPLLAPKKLSLDGGHVIVTGGSSGIGKAVAIEAAKLGSNVTLLARNKNKLVSAQHEVEKHLKDPSKQTVLTVSVDVGANYDDLEKAIQKAEEKNGPTSMLVNSAGLAVNGVFEELPLEDFQRSMSINYLGSVYAARAVLGGMKARRAGRVVFVSSQAGQVGLFGFTAYSASKFALRGLAEALQMEVLPYNIHVTVAYPPDTDTPGFEEEKKTKPVETRLISETAGLFQADYVAKEIINGSLRGSFSCWVGTDGWMLAQLTAGMAPLNSLIDGLQQVALMGVFRAVALCYLTHFNRIVRRCSADRKHKQQ